MAYTVSGNEFTNPSYPGGPWRPVCICGGYATKGSYGGGVGHQTESLNHLAHKCNKSMDTPNNQGGGGLKGSAANPLGGQSAKDMNAMKHHEWMHVAYCWDMSGQNVHLMVNGKVYSTTPPEVFVHPQPTTAADWTSRTRSSAGRTVVHDAVRRQPQLTVDGTLTSSTWKGKTFDTVTQLYDQGRYGSPVWTGGHLTSSDPGRGPHRPETLSPHPSAPIVPVRRAVVAPRSPDPDLSPAGCAQADLRLRRGTPRPSTQGVPMMIDKLEDEDARVEVRMQLLDGESR
jgi:hypothetical protein